MGDSSATILLALCAQPGGSATEESALPQQLLANILTLVTNVFVTNVTAITMTTFLTFSIASILTSPLVIYEDAQGTVLGTMQQTSSIVSRTVVSNGIPRRCVEYVPLPNEFEERNNNTHELFRLMCIDDAVIPIFYRGSPVRNVDLKD